MSKTMNCIYKDPNAPIEARVKDLLSLMTLEEKVGQMTQIERSVATPSAIKDLSIDPRWGRSYESFGEDTQIVKMMTSMVTGLQGQAPQEHPSVITLIPTTSGSLFDKKFKLLYRMISVFFEVLFVPLLAQLMSIFNFRKNVVACAKHFVGDGGTRNGINEGDAIVTYDELEKIHISPYIDCISQGVCTIMASYSSWNGVKLHDSNFLLTEILKEKLGFKGFIISDSEGLDRLSTPHGSDYRQSVLSAISAGIDMVMVPFRFKLFLEDLMHLVESGKIPMARIDDAVERILRVKFASGLFEHPLSDGSLLDTVGTTILDALKEIVGDETELIYEEDPSPTTFLEKNYSFAIVVIGEGPYAEFGGDSTELKIHFNGAELLNMVPSEVPTLAVLISGRPLALEPRLLEKMDALVAAWLPGTEGGGVIDVIFGDHEFQGRLPITWFKSVHQLPMHAEDSSYDPLFPIGFVVSSQIIRHLKLAAYRTKLDFQIAMDCIYKDPNAPIEARVKDLLSRMTLLEKIGQMTQIERSVATPSAIKDRFIDADLSRKIGEVTALETRASGAQYAFSPCVAVSRDPRWGRSYESYSENTELVRKMTSIVTGLQGQPPEGHPNGYPFLAGRNNVLASAKHFVGDGGTENGKNEGNTITSYDELEQIHLAPYLDCISQGVCTVMASYSSWNGSKLHTDHFLLTEVLKNKLGFKGFVISDWEALDRLYVPHGSNYRTTILDAIKEVVDDKTEVIYELNPSEETFSGQDFSFAIVAIGEAPYVESGGDDPELKIPFNGAELASLVANKVPTLVILVTGRPLVLEPSFLEKIDGLVVAWLPGTEGKGITDVIFGDYPFQGLLPMTWFRSIDQLPVHAGQNSLDPLFPFGFGLTS
ncbi:hypothetical protein ACJIZ3_012493 [Penstemon smallii]|uniref:Beta-glucosidase n=1 Tax=Penstemon smallii TaxID=265156 RepID=A0ABD3UM76_9LAMI